MSEDMLEGDANSVVIDGLPDLSKYLFIHSSIDDAGLDPYEFRIFCHLRRRSKDRMAWPGMRSIAETTGISRNKVCLTVHSLRDKGFLKVQKRPGNHRSNVYLVQLPAESSVLVENAVLNSVPVKSAEPSSVPVGDTSVPVRDSSVPGGNTRVSTEGNPLKEIQEINNKHISLYNDPAEQSPKPQSSVTDPKPETSAPVTESFVTAHSGVFVLEGPLQEPGRPKGMPPLDRVKGYLAQKGLPESDALCVYASWKSNGFTGKNGKLIKDWRANIDTKIHYRSLPSQRIKPPVSEASRPKARYKIAPVAEPEQTPEERAQTILALKQMKELCNKNKSQNGSKA